MSHVKAETEEEKEDVKELGQDLLRRHEQLAQMEQLLPAESGTYLKIILGNVNVSILDKKARYDYKDQYEQFKLIVNLIGFVLSCTNLYIQYRVLDLLFMFLIVWYYCTLTIRESILRVNGSRIKVGKLNFHIFIYKFIFRKKKKKRNRNIFSIFEFLLIV